MGPELKAAAKMREAGGQTIETHQAETHQADSCRGGGFTSGLGAADVGQSCAVTWPGPAPLRASGLSWVRPGFSPPDPALPLQFLFLLGQPRCLVILLRASGTVRYEKCFWGQTRNTFLVRVRPAGTPFPSEPIPRTTGSPAAAPAPFSQAPAGRVRSPSRAVAWEAPLRARPGQEMQVRLGHHPGSLGRRQGGHLRASAPRWERQPALPLGSSRTPSPARRPRPAG